MRNGPLGGLDGSATMTIAALRADPDKTVVEAALLNRAAAD